MSSVSSMKVDELRAELQSRGADSSGRKAVLVSRLQALIVAEEAPSDSSGDEGTAPAGDEPSSKKRKLEDISEENGGGEEEQPEEEVAEAEPENLENAPQEEQPATIEENGAENEQQPEGEEDTEMADADDAPAGEEDTTTADAPQEEENTEEAGNEEKTTEGGEEQPEGEQQEQPQEEQPESSDDEEEELTLDGAHKLLEGLQHDKLLEFAKKLITDRLDHPDIVELQKEVQNDPHKCRIFVRSLPFHLDSDGLEKVFAQFGRIDEAIVINERGSSKSRGFGFITFAKPKHAQRALNAESIMVGDRELHCNLANTKPEHQRRERSDRSDYGGGRSGGGGYGGGGGGYGGSSRRDYGGSNDRRGGGSDRYDRGGYSDKSYDRSYDRGSRYGGGGGGSYYDSYNDGY